MRLRKLACSVPIAVLALAAMFNLACSLPTVKPRMAPEFAKGKTKVKSVAVLPVDLSVQVEGEDKMVRSDNGLGSELMERIYNGISKSLHKRGYRVKAFVEPDGRTHHKKKLVIHPSDLSALRVEIHQSTAAFGPGPGYIGMTVSSPLTRQIQATTGADASLYARGWIYIGREDSAALTAVKIIGIAIFAIVIVGLLVMMFAGGGKGKKGKKSKFKSSKSRRSRRSSRGGAAKALFGVTRAVVKTAAAVGRVTVRAMPHVLDAAAHAHVHSHCDVPCHTCPPPPPPPPPPPAPPPPPVVEEPGMQDDGVLRGGPDEVMDGIVVRDEPVEVVTPPEALPAPPVAHPTDKPKTVKQAHDAERPVPRRILLHQGKAPTKSTVSLAVSLVHNKNGRVLWHAGQSFEVKVDKGYNIQAFIDHFFENLPRAR
jgi:hypothetical protein